MTKLTISTAVAALAVTVCGACDYRDAAAVEEGTSSCARPLVAYDAGPELAGLKVTHREALCSSRPPHIFVVYGTCHAESDTGCAPPLEVQTYRACDRSPADYTRAGRRLRPRRATTIRGVPARSYGDGRLELSTGKLTVVIFGRSKQLRERAAAALQPALRPPVPGAQEGKLRCQ